MDLNYFRRRLEARVKQIRSDRDHAQAGANTVELDQTRVGRLSRMDALQMQEMNLESLRRRQRELLALEHALKRIDDGDYGICARCEEEINPKRLEIDLTAHLCIDCANLQSRE